MQPPEIVTNKKTTEGGARQNPTLLESKTLPKFCTLEMEDAFDTALHLITKKKQSFPRQMAKCTQPSNWRAQLFSQQLVHEQTLAIPTIVSIIA